MLNGFHYVNIVTLLKTKSNKADCGNYHGISLLAIAGRIPAQVILNYLISSVSEDTLPESHCGFRPDCRICQHGILIETSSGEMYQAAYIPLHCLH